MKKFILCLFALCASLVAANAAESWTENYDAALKTAKTDKKNVLVLFTGSDWCPPCMYMEKNVFPSKPFAEFADKNLVLVKLDFPRRKEQADATKAANAALAKQYEIEGFPTVVILSPDGKEIARRVGAASDADFVAWLKKVQEKSSKKDDNKKADSKKAA